MSHVMDQVKFAKVLNPLTHDDSVGKQPDTSFPPSTSLRTRQTTPQEPEDWMKAPAGVDGGAVTVHVRVALKKVSRVDTVQGTAYVKMGLVFYWTDPRLVGWPDVEDLPQLLWTPVLLLTNTGGTEFYAAPDGLHCIEADTGRLKRGYNYEGTVEWSLDGIGDFPFDIQALPIRFYTESNWSTPNGDTVGLDPKERQYHLQEVVEDSGEGTFWWQGWDGSIHEWELHGYSECISELPPTPSGALGTEMVIEMHMSRKSYYYGKLVLALLQCPVCMSVFALMLKKSSRTRIVTVTKLFFPLFTMAGMSFFSFGYDLGDLDGRCSFMATLFLSNISMIFVIGETVPKGIEETPIDRVVSLQLIGLFSTCAMHVVLSTMKRNDVPDNQIQALQFTFIVAMAIAFGVIYTLILPAWWRNRRRKVKLNEASLAERWLRKHEVIQEGFKYKAAK